MDLLNKKVLVVGMKTSGISACSLLKNYGANVCFYDDFYCPLQNEFENVTDKSIEYIFKDLELVVLSPSIPESHFIVKKANEDNIIVISELELGSYFLNCKKIVVTGTNGKTTTINMLDKILSNMGYKVKSMGNNGYPVSQVVLDGTELDFAIIEASSFQLDNIKNLKPYISILLNISPDHQDRYNKFFDYVNSKKKIFKNQDQEDFALFNYDDKLVRALSRDCKAKIIFFSTKEKKGNVYIKDNYYFVDDIPLCHIKESKARGEHNRYNLLSAMNVAYLLNCQIDHLKNLIKYYVPLPHRIEYVATIKEKKFYNDSKGTNINACQYAIECVEGNIGLIMGGSDKKEDYCDFFENINERVKYITITGSNAEKIFDCALKMGFCNISKEQSLKKCIQKLTLMPNIESVLFSPSAASFDRYKNYAERGDAFKGLVYEIKV